MAESAVAPNSLQALVRHRGEGEARWWMGSLSVVVAGGQETGGQFALVDVTDPEGEEVPMHVHHREDETFIVLEGEIDFNIGGREIQARAGSTLFGPRGIPHSYVVRRGPSRMLFLFMPAGFEGAVMETSEPAREMRLPSDGETRPDMEAFPTILQRYGCEFVAEDE